jgi:hypothetical protein
VVLVAVAVDQVGLAVQEPQAKETLGVLLLRATVALVVAVRVLWVRMVSRTTWVVLVVTGPRVTV